MKELVASIGGSPPWRSIRNFETSMIGWCHVGGPLADATGTATKRVHGWSAKFAAMYPEEGFEVVVEPVPSPTVWKQTVVLVGGGHAHAQVIKEYNHVNVPRWVRVVLIDPLKKASYSGMVPGAVAGQYTPEQTQIQLEPLAKWAGTQYFNASVIDVDPEARVLHLGPSPYTDPDGLLPEGVPASLSYDVVSFDIGSRTAHTDTPGVQEYAIATRPIHLLVSRIDERIAKLTRSSVNVVVCGAGAAGIELALTIAARIRSNGMEVTATLVDANAALLSYDTPMVRKAIASIMAGRGIQVLHNRRVDRITATDVVLDNGDAIPQDVAIWPVGAASHLVAAKLAAAGVATSPEGWIRVSNTLQSVSHPSIFAAGDCCTFEHLARQPGKAGVYAVRTGPVLMKNLLGFLQGCATLQEYTPQPDFLRLFNCGDGYGFGVRFGVFMYGPWVWEWKDFIDQWFMNLFKVENLPDLSTLKGADERQFDSALRSVVSGAPAEPAAAAKVLTSVDAELVVVKSIINRMSQDDEYCRKVVEQAWSISPDASG